MGVGVERAFAIDGEIDADEDDDDDETEQDVSRFVATTVPVELGDTEDSLVL